MQRHSWAEAEQVGLPLELLADVAEPAGAAVTVGDHEVRADEDHHLADVDDLLGAWRTPSL